MPDQLTFRNQDLVLNVSASIDPTRFNINRYEPFLDTLCGSREYQKEAIRVTLRYFFGGPLCQLARFGRREFQLK